MAEQGTTTVEAKSGYGLTVDSEIKSLEAIRSAAAKWPGTVIATLLGAHVVPKEFQGRAQEYVDVVCEQMIPRAARAKTGAVRGRIHRSRSVYRGRHGKNIRGREKTRSGSAGPRLPVERDRVAAAVALQRRVVRSHGSRQRAGHRSSWQRPKRLQHWCREQIIFSVWRNFRPPAS